MLLQTDSYKVSHWKQYPPGTTNVYSYLESRGGDYPRVTFFGLQYIIQCLRQPINLWDIEEASRFYAQHFGRSDLFNRAGWEHIVKHHDGLLPLRIMAVREGSTHPTHTPLMTVENTDPECYWLTNYVETILSQVWYPTTVATLSRHCRQTIEGWLNRTGNDPVGFKLHDFGYRGSTSEESAAIGGAAHLVNFRGTDTVAALRLLSNYYGCAMAGFSIPAAEHSTITSWGQGGELDAYRNMLTQYPEGLVAVVSDSYDIFNAITNLWGGELKPMVTGRYGVLVIRPDSGYPPTIINRCLELCEQAFGATVNNKGYKVLNPKVRLIQGDGVDPAMINEVLRVMAFHKWSADNIAFGMGGGLLQSVTRDTCKFAFKCSSVVVDGVERDVWKSPVTDQGKSSKRGRFTDSNLELVYENGIMQRTQTLDDIRELAQVNA